MEQSSIQPLLSVRDLTLQGPGDTPVVNTLSFDVPPGEVVALVGESGSGKTVTGRAILRLLPSQIRQVAGRIDLSGRALGLLSEAAMREVRGALIGMVFQEPLASLNPAMTVGSQLGEALILHRKISPQEARRLSIAMLERVQFVDAERCLAAYPHQFSGGMRQRIMLASVMLLQPRLLIADEPTTALDSLSQRDVMETMAELTKTSGTAVLLITHDLGLVARYAQRVVVLQRGQLVESGRVSSVLRQPQTAYTQSLIDALPKRRDPYSLKISDAALIEARDLVVQFGIGDKRASGKTTRAVDGVSLAIHAGEVVAVVGGSGSGKTTFGRALLGLLPRSGGDIVFRGNTLANSDSATKRAFRLDCQLMFQDPYSSLDPRQRVGDIVAEPLRHGASIRKVERRRLIGEMLEEVGLADFALRYPHALSGGQRQRVAIARALIRKPAFVVADEPVSALDMTIQKQVLELLRTLQQRYGFACLFISHNLAAVSEIADRIVVMHQGRIVEEGNVTDIFDHPQHEYTPRAARRVDRVAVRHLDQRLYASRSA